MNNLIIERNTDVELTREDLTLPVKFLLSPLLDSDTKIFIAYFMHHAILPDFEFNFSKFQSMTGIGRTRTEKARNVLEELELLVVYSSKKGCRTEIEKVTFNYSALVNYLNQPLKIKRRKPASVKAFILEQRRLKHLQIEQVEEE